MKIKNKHLAGKLIMLFANLLPFIGVLMFTLFFKFGYQNEVTLDQLLSNASEPNEQWKQLIADNIYSIKNSLMSGIYWHGFDNLFTIGLTLFSFIGVLAFINILILCRMFGKSNDSSLMNFVTLSTSMITFIGIIGAILYYISLNKTLSTKTTEKRFNTGRILILTGSIITLIIVTSMLSIVLINLSSFSQDDYFNGWNNFDDDPSLYSTNTISWEHSENYNTFFGSSNIRSRIEISFTYRDGGWEFQNVNHKLDNYDGGEIQPDMFLSFATCLTLLLTTSSMYIVSISSISIRSKSLELDRAIKVPGLIINCLFGGIGSLMLASNEAIDNNSQLDEKEKITLKKEPILIEKTKFVKISLIIATVSTSIMTFYSFIGMIFGFLLIFPGFGWLGMLIFSLTSLILSIKGLIMKTDKINRSYILIPAILQIIQFVYFWSLTLLLMWSLLVWIVAILFIFFTLASGIVSAVATAKGVSPEIKAKLKQEKIDAKIALLQAKK